MDELLKAYAKKRREEAGVPLELHPATRRLLLAEVARVFRRPEASVAWWLARLKRRWPHVALATSLLVAVSLVVHRLAVPAGRSGLRMEMARADGRETAREQPKENRPAALPEPIPPPLPEAARRESSRPVDPVTARPPSAASTPELALDSPRASQTQPPPTQVPGELASAADRVSVGQPRLTSLVQAVIKASPSEPHLGLPTPPDELALAAGTPGSRLAAARAVKQDGARILEPVANEGGAPRSAPVTPLAQTRRDDARTVMVDRPLFSDKDKDQGFQFTAAPAQSDPASGDLIGADPSFRWRNGTTSGAGTHGLPGSKNAVQPVGRREISLASRLRFVRTGQGRTDTTGALLNAFEIERTDEHVRLLDADGSVYEGQLLNATNIAELPGTEQGGRLLAELRRDKGHPPADSHPAKQTERFRASGTSRSLRQFVLITGDLMSEAPSGTETVDSVEHKLELPPAAPVAAPLPVLKSRAARPPAPASRARVEAESQVTPEEPALSADLSPTRFRGTVRIGTTNLLTIEAVRAHP
jgi:hypothetical protein